MYAHNKLSSEEIMPTIFAENALLPAGWAENVLVTFSKAGVITHVETDQIRSSDSHVGLLVPAPVNVHSHAFQRAMAGLTEARGSSPSDSFWTWRSLMFKFLDQLQPHHIETISTFVQMEMLEAGYATNVEFHYLHHQPGGAPYSRLSELAQRIISASQESGIGLTLLPVFYQYGGCDQRDLNQGQVRFGNDIHRYMKLYDELECSRYLLRDDDRLGIAPHSLRAVGQDQLRELSNNFSDIPIHMHLAEQLPEIDEVKSSWGKRPVEWALDNLPINQNWCLIHCTQMNALETKNLARTGAVAGLCPITESSLGDGIFDGVNWLGHFGKVAIGSDSNILISLNEEIRTLEYSQRLRDHSRSALASHDKSTGRRIFDEILAGGGQAAGRKTGMINEGYLADLLAYDTSSPDLIHASGDRFLDTIFFTNCGQLVSHVWSAGRHLVKDGRHVARKQIVEAYVKTMKELETNL